MIFNFPQEVINRSLKEKEGKSSINAPFTCLYSAPLSPPSLSLSLSSPPSLSLLASLSLSLLPPSLSSLPLSPPSLSLFLLQVIKPEMKAYLAELRKRIVIGVVGGSDKAKQEEQMGGDGRKFNTCTSTCQHVTTTQTMHVYSSLKNWNVTLLCSLGESLTVAPQCVCGVFL